MKKYAYIAVATVMLAFVAGTAMADSAFDAHRASNLIKAQAIDPSGKTLGTIDDLLLGSDHKISYVVVAKTDMSGYVAVPIEAAAPRVNPIGQVVLGISKENFDKVHVSAINDWPGMTSSDEARGYRGGLESQRTESFGVSTLNPYPF